MSTQTIDFFHGGASPKTRPVSFFFYHVPKCGGMAIHALAKSCWVQMAKHEGLDAPIVERVDEQASLGLLKERPYAFISSHLPYGTHSLLAGDPHLITVLRDPTRKVRSAYTYHSMRHGQAPSAEKFGKFIRLPVNQNTMTRMLSGLGLEAEVGPAALQSAIENLEQKFALFATSQDTKALCETILSACSLPNVIATRINRTTPQYQIDEAPFIPRIRACNEYDEALFDYVARHKKCALGEKTSKAAPDSEHPLTVMLVEKEHPEGNVVKSFMLPTAFLREIKLLGGNGTIDEDIYRDFIRSMQQQGGLS